MISLQSSSLLRSLHLLSNIPLVVTLLDPSGPVVFQNELSLGYWGDLLLPPHLQKQSVGAPGNTVLSSPQVRNPTLWGHETTGDSPSC